MDTTQELLAARIRRETAQDHSQAEGGGFLGSLTQGSVSADAYRDLLVQLLPVYEVLEAFAAKYRGDGQLVSLFDPQLDRADRLRADLAALPGDSDVLPQTHAYVTAIQKAGDASATLLLAHHYTRYLGDLSGGQFIGRAIARAFGDTVANAMSWFNFDELGDLTEYKDNYRAHLDALNLSDADAVALIDEVHAAYTLNTDVLDALAQRHSA